MRLQLPSILLLIVLLAACGTPAATEPTPIATEPTPIAVEPTADPGVAAPTESPVLAEPTQDTGEMPALGMQVYAIVPEESQVSYEVGEVFFREGNRFATAIGVTQIITGEIRFDQRAPQYSTVGPINIDIQAFTSDDARRDNRIRQEWLESARFPIATFVPNAIAGLPASYTYGEEITLQITGDLTIRDTTNSVTFETTGSIAEDDTMIGTATTNIKMTDFGFDPPDIAGILKAEDDVKITFNFVARPVSTSR